MKATQSISQHGKNQGMFPTFLAVVPLLTKLVQNELAVDRRALGCREPSWSLGEGLTEWVETLGANAGAGAGAVAVHVRRGGMEDMVPVLGDKLEGDRLAAREEFTSGEGGLDQRCVQESVGL